MFYMKLTEGFYYLFTKRLKKYIFNMKEKENVYIKKFVYEKSSYGTIIKKRNKIS